jgi:hypothetical protein
MTLVIPRRVVRGILWLALYAAAYLGASYADLWTTRIAVAAGGEEGNVLATSQGVYDAEKAWVITALGGLCMVYAVFFALRHADDVSDTALAHPVRSLFPIYFNPWARKVRDRAPLHAMSYAIAFVALRLFAALNNALIAIGQNGQISWAVGRVAQAMPVALAFAVVLAALYFAFVAILLPLSARWLRLWRGDRCRFGTGAA